MEKQNQIDAHKREKKITAVTKAPRGELKIIFKSKHVFELYTNVMGKTSLSIPLSQ